MEPFGAVMGDARIAPGNPGSAYVKETELGSIIAKAIVGIQRQFSILQVYQYKVMPDHVHILLRVKDWSDQHLDFYMDALVSSIAEKYSSMTGRNIYCADIFQPGYCDKPLLLKRNLDSLFSYIRENPGSLSSGDKFLFMSFTHF